MRVGLPNPHAPRVKLDTSAGVQASAAKHGWPIADSCWTRFYGRHGYIAFEPLCGAPAEHAGRTTKSPCPAVNAGHQRWCPGFSRQAWLADRRFVLDTDSTTGTDTSPLSRYAEPQRSMRVGIAESPCPRVNAGHQRWCPGFSRQAGCPSADSCWTRMLRTDTDTSPLSRYAEPQRSMRVGIAESPCPARKRWTPALVSRLQPPSLVARVPIRVGHGCCGRTRIHRP